MKKIYTILTMLALFCTVSCEDLGIEIFNPNGKPNTEDETQGGVTPAANEIWYTNGSTTEATAPYKTDVFGVNIISNTYDSENERWVIKFDGDVISIGGGAFAYCSSLTSINLPESVTEIGENAFRDCSSLTSITIPNSVTSIGKNAFTKCSSLTSVTIGEIVTEIGNEAFFDCTNLREFRGKFASEDGRCLIVDGVLHSFAPADLMEYAIPNSVTSIGKGAFQVCSSLTSVTIPNSVTEIGAFAFQVCRSLISVKIGENVTSIGEFAFWDCNSLTSITIPNSVTEIGYSAFQNCLSLTSVNIPESVTSIGKSAFQGCRSLTSVYCKATTPPTVGNYIFGNNASGRKIYVPAASVEAYKTAEGWSEYASDIVGYDF